ncbi:MAG: glycoside hydrolase family 3 C-terminal domain-containing protein, partial [Firmicutes bacterium]|nr:glycoside hydrolase family 3 C-terminal domain-containing protein [Bacillota bacterium]
MSSYNKYNGSYCGHSDYLLNKVLKEEWDFDGFVMSDFIWGIRDTEEAANGGQDMEMCCTQFYGDKLVQAVKEGKVPEEKINQAVLRIIRTIISFGDEDDKTYDESVIGCKEHVGLALEAARKGITLIQNKNRMLPMNREETARIVVFGRLADKGNVGDYGSSRVFPQYVITPLQGIATVAIKSEVIFYHNTNMEHAKKLAAGADYTVFVVGYDHEDEGEYISEEQLDGYTSAIGGDRKNSLGLRKEEVKLIQEVGPVNKNSCVVLIGGNLIMMEEWKDYVSSILMAYYPGMEGGKAIAEILFGDINPSGKLPYVVPFKESDLPQVNWNSEMQYYDYYHGYTKLEKEGIKPCLSYGFGLSYTQFSISDAAFSVDENVVMASCKVKNTGAVMGTEVIQMYVGFKNSKINRPVKILRGFKRVELESGNEKAVTITCPIDKLKWYNPKTESWELEHMEYEIYIGTSSDDNNLLKGRFIL